MLEGAMGIVVAGRERRLGAGDVEVVPPQTPHHVFAVDGGQVRARFTTQRALFGPLAALGRLRGYRARHPYRS